MIYFFFNFVLVSVDICLYFVKVNDDIMSLASTNVSVQWTATDPESEIPSCEISVGG